MTEFLAHATHCNCTVSISVTDESNVIHEETMPGQHVSSGGA